MVRETPGNKEPPNHCCLCRWRKGRAARNVDAHQGWKGEEDGFSSRETSLQTP